MQATECWLYASLEVRSPATLHSAFGLLHSLWGGFVGALGSQSGGYQLPINRPWGGLGVALGGLARMQNQECRMQKASRGMPSSAILHSVFCDRRFERGALQQARRSGGGPGAVWYWSGGGLTLIAQSSDTK